MLRVFTLIRSIASAHVVAVVPFRTPLPTARHHPQHEQGISLGPPRAGGGAPRNPPAGSLAGGAQKRSTTPNKQPKGGTDTGPQDPVPTQAPEQSASGGAPAGPDSAGSWLGGGTSALLGPPVPKGPPATLRSGGSGGDGGFGGGGPPRGPPTGRVVPPRDDMDWRDRAIRAEALLERVQGELQETKGRNAALELRIQDLETQNRNLYAQAVVAEQWNEWFPGEGLPGGVPPRDSATHATEYPSWDFSWNTWPWQPRKIYPREI